MKSLKYNTAAESISFGFDNEGLGFYFPHKCLFFLKYMYQEPIILQQHDRFVCSSCLLSTTDFYMVPLIPQTFCLGPQSLFQCHMKEITQRI